jgi:hypothetical protein
VKKTEKMNKYFALALLSVVLGRHCRPITELCTGNYRLRDEPGGIEHVTL